MINDLNLLQQAVESWELELRYLEEVSCLFHGVLQLHKLIPVVIKLTPISHEVHLAVKVCKKVIEFLRKVIQILSLSFKLHLSRSQSSLFASFDLFVLFLEIFTTLFYALFDKVEKLIQLLECLFLVLCHGFLAYLCIFYFIMVLSKDCLQLFFHSMAFHLKTHIYNGWYRELSYFSRGLEQRGRHLVGLWSRLS